LIGNKYLLVSPPRVSVLLDHQFLVTTSGFDQGVTGPHLLSQVTFSSILSLAVYLLPSAFFFTETASLWEQEELFWNCWQLFLLLCLAYTSVLVM